MILTVRCLVHSVLQVASSQRQLSVNETGRGSKGSLPRLLGVGVKEGHHPAIWVVEVAEAMHKAAKATRTTGKTIQGQASAHCDDDYIAMVPACALLLQGSHSLLQYCCSESTYGCLSLCTYSVLG